MPLLSLLIHVSGLDDACCAQKVAVALRAVESVQGVYVATDGRACVTSTVAVRPEGVKAALTAAGYSATTLEAVDQCPAGLSAPAGDPWTGIDDLDAKVISRGEVADLAAFAAAGKFTVYDFGADWCAPCHTTAATLQAYLRTHEDVAVRAVLLGGTDAKSSFAAPIVKQHLQFAAGLPHLIVRSAAGKTVYEGSDIAAALAAIDKKRK
jgi:thiol-disulfide isomerase/thioredoxin